MHQRCLDNWLDSIMILSSNVNKNISRGIRDILKLSRYFDCNRNFCEQRVKETEATLAQQARFAFYLIFEMPKLKSVYEGYEAQCRRRGKGESKFVERN